MKQTEQEKEQINILLPIIETNIQGYKRLKEQALVQIKSSKICYVKQLIYKLVKQLFAQNDINYAAKLQIGL